MSKSTKVLIAIAALGWGLLALFYGYGVFALYQSGDGELSDFVVPGIPLGALAVAIVVPMILSRVGWARSAFVFATFFVVALLPALVFTLALMPY